jgi:hypothetical protein
MVKEYEMSDTQTRGFADDPALAGSGSAGCCGTPHRTGGIAAPAATDASAAPCCGTAVDAQASGGCCGTAAKAEVAAAGAGCCG